MFAPFATCSAYTLALTFTDQSVSPLLVSLHLLSPFAMPYIRNVGELSNICGTFNCATGPSTPFFDVGFFSFSDFVLSRLSTWIY